MNFLNLKEYKRLLETYSNKKKNKWNSIDFWYAEPNLETEKNVKKGLYPLDYSKLSKYSGDLDKDNVLYLNYGGSLKNQYHPAAISTFALANYTRYQKTKNKKYKDLFLSQANWLMKNQTSSGLWPNKFKWAGLNPMWSSAHDSGISISTLIRAYKLTKKSAYITSLKKAIIPFKKALEKGGLSYKTREGFTYYSDITPAKKPFFVLNKLCFALIALYEYNQTFKDKESKVLFKNGLKTLKNYLPKYSGILWSRYDLDSFLFLQNTASPHYHRLHIQLMNILNQITKDPFFFKYSQKWKRQLNSPLKKYLSIMSKTVYKLIVK